jgi:hypothetical protein
VGYSRASQSLGPQRLRCGDDLTSAIGLSRRKSQKSPQDPQLLRPMRSIGFAHRLNAEAVLDHRGRFASTLRPRASEASPAPT